MKFKCPYVPQECTQLEHLTFSEFAYVYFLTHESIVLIYINKNFR